MPDNQLANPAMTPTGRPARAARQRDILRSAVENNHLNDQRLVAGFVDIDGVSETINSLVDAFPGHFRHTFAAKANAMSGALSIVRDHGLGCEVASAGELQQALRVGFKPESIVYDEPAKTEQSLGFVLDRGINLNIDNFQEFERVLRIVGRSSPKSNIGFRINPQVGSGSIGPMSTATATSKFGVALRDEGNRERLIELYGRYSWLNSVHTHIGSQGCSLDLMIDGISDVVELAKEVNASGGNISTIDIGGGLSVNFASDHDSPTFGDYSTALRSAVPELFDGQFTVKTEFGRSLFAKNGFIAARVEYTKESGGRRIAITHAGAQTATRTTFMPDLWTIRISVFDANGQPRTAAHVEQDIAGPCCFAGDMLAERRALPLIEAGDYVMLHDTGAYYFSNPFYYNSLPPCSVFGALWQDGAVRLDTWREQQSTEDMLALLG